MIEVMKQIALQAGAIAYADQLQMKSSNIHNKGTILDMVTDTDKKVEKFITGELLKNFPDCGIYGEETGKNHAERSLCFIIDPIDGTTSFIHHLPNWCISIGAVMKGEHVAGVIFQPATGKLFYAEKGKGSYCNGVRLHVSETDTLTNSVVVTGFACLRAQWREENNLKWFTRIAPLVSDIRKYGSAAMDCCTVAEGHLEAYWELFLQPYDVAAGIVIAMEAGATVTDLHGGKEYPHHGFLVTNSKLHDTMLEFFTDFKHLNR